MLLFTLLFLSTSIIYSEASSILECQTIVRIDPVRIIWEKDEAYVREDIYIPINNKESSLISRFRVQSDSSTYRCIIYNGAKKIITDYKVDHSYTMEEQLYVHLYTEWAITDVDEVVQLACRSSEFTYWSDITSNYTILNNCDLVIKDPKMTEQYTCSIGTDKVESFLYVTDLE